PCDVRKREYCLKHPSGRYYTCQCKAGEKRQPVTDVCLKNECLSGEDDCDVNAICTDTDDSYICNCRPGFLDQSPDPVNKPGRVCSDLSRDCERNSRCSPNAICTNTPDGQVCRCGPGFVDVSPNPQNEPGIICKPEVNECARPDLNNCHRDALCIDTTDSYKCICKAGYKDLDELRNPGRQCQKINVLIDECKENRHTCSPNADCRDLEEGYTCECKDGYVDHSPNLLTEPGRVCDTPEVCPPNHDCSSAAVCKPLGGNKYTCTCIQGYLDQSPAGKQGTVCVRDDRCKDPKLNNCSRNAICYNEPNGGYRCECIRGYEDRSPQGGPKGRVCEPPKPPPPKPRHPCQDPNLNDCHASGACRATGPETYTCECLPGYVDRSPDVKNKPGRVCVISEPICLDSSRNDCHPAAICSETQNEDGYTCRCRDGYIDQSPGKDRRPGRICVEQVNECLDRSLNDCDPIAVCEDQPEGYTCRCPVNAIDQSPDKNRPGRKCFLKVDECANPSLNNCSRFADCVDKEDGYECKCRSGYHDENPAQPGTVCNYIINECESPNLNDCHRNAECIDTPGGYECKCKNPYHDEGPKDRPGRICRYNECADPKAHKCDANADCVDTEDGYVCSCRDGFYDNSPDPTIPGQVCIEFQEEPKVTPPAEASEKLIPCGHLKCDPKRNETCIGGRRCGCRPGEGRASPQDACEPIEKIPLAFRVVSRGQQPLLYSSQYGNSDSPDYVEITNEFDKDLGSAVGSTVYAPRYVATDVSYITHPKTINSSWPDGLLVNFTVGTRPSATPIDVCDLWDKLMESIQQTNGAIGGGQLHVASDIDLLDPCAKPVPTGELCGGQYCNAELGEVCIAGTVCGCVNGEKRASPKDHCRPVEPVNFPLWVIRKNHNQLTYNDTFGNPQDAINKQYVDDFNNGIADSYPQTTLKNGFVTSDVIDITDPKLVNATWDKGVIFNATMYFRRGTIRSPQETYQVLVDYILHRNNLEIGHSGLFLNPYQPNPFSSCYGNTCHAAGKCIELGPNAYRCECGAGYRDKNPIDPGRTCIRIDDYNECERDEDNDCSVNARCIDLPHLYRCECNNGYKDASPKNELPGSVCVLDYCSDVNFCPANTTCVNQELQAVCVCLPGMIDIRKSNMKAQSGIDQSTLCLNVID
uniref:Uncharacterized protein n=1 Tax=Acrobeloides nanus TaxID=290746 RepID=A0A914CT96_9BILA